MRSNRTHTKLRASRLLLIGAILPGVVGLAAHPAAAATAVPAATPAPAMTPAPSAAATKKVLEVRVSRGSDDVEERTDGTMYINSSDLELVNDNDRSTAIRRQMVGLRFAGVNIPKGATITNAHIEFRVDPDTSSEPTSLLIRGEKSPNSATFSGSAGNVRSRSQTAAFAQWTAIEPWTTEGATERSVDLSSIVGEVIAQPGWTSGNPVTFLIDGYGRRVAKAFEGSSSDAALLRIEYTDSTPEPDPKPEPPAAGETVAQVVDGKDDVEEQSPNGRMYLDSSDLELVTDGAKNQKVGIRFAQVDVPAGAKIDSAYVEFVADRDQRDVSSGQTDLTIRAEASANSARFSGTSNDVSRRTLTSAQVGWPSVEPWTTPLEKHQSVDLAPVVQEVVSQQGWASGNPVTLVITGSGRRNAASYEDSPGQAPRLHIKYSTGGTTPTNPARQIVSQPEQFGVLRGKDWSGLTYQRGTGDLSGSGYLWAVNNDTSALTRFPANGDQSTKPEYLTDEMGRSFDAEALTINGGGEFFVAGEGHADGLPNAIYHYDVSMDGAKPKATLKNTWDFGSVGQMDQPIFPRTDPDVPESSKILDNEGIEALAWMPYEVFGDVATRFQSNNDAIQGFFAIGTETRGTVYFVVMYPHYSDSGKCSVTPIEGRCYEVVGSVETGLNGVMALEWDGRELWAYCDEDCGQTTNPNNPAEHFAILRPDQGIPKLVGRWPTAPEMELVGLEGFAIEPFDYCSSQGKRYAHWTDDNGRDNEPLWGAYIARCD